MNPKRNSRYPNPVQKLKPTPTKITETSTVKKMNPRSHHQKERSSLRNRNQLAGTSDEGTELKSRAIKKRNMSRKELM